MMRRLDAGGLIDRAQPLEFRFDGRTLNGFAGDTLASALLANGVTVVGRSFKYHRPRGFLSAGSEEPNALVELGQGVRRTPNTKATTVELYGGLVAQSQNRWPSLRLDLLALNRLAAPFLPAGFYYKTFMWPARFWEKVYEPLIRRAAGLGRASGAPDPDCYEKATLFTDVLVVGAGPAGLMAALASGRSGARVVLADEDFQLGGRLLAEDHSIDGGPATAWLARAAAELAAMAEVRILSRTTVFGAYDDGTFGAVERVADHLPEPPPFQPRQRLWTIVAKRTILATGATERPLVFPDNDRPGVMLAGAALAYRNRFALMPIGPVAIVTNNDGGWQTGLRLARAGAAVAAVIDTRDAVDALVTGPCVSAGIRPMPAAQVTATRGTPIHAIRVAQGGRAEWLSVGGLLMAGGWSPNIQLLTHRGEKPAWDPAIAAFAADGSSSDIAVCGAAAGRFGLCACLGDGDEAGAAAAKALGFSTTPPNVPRADDARYAIQATWSVSGRPATAFVDYQNDVTAKDIEVAWREGFRSVEHLKRYTTLGMATDQGRTANVAGAAIMADLCGADIAGSGTPRFRPPYTPVAIGALAGTHRGPHFRPTRLAPTHRWAARHGAVFTETGPWMRAQYFPQPGEDDPRAAISREAAAVRAAVGFCDVSTLGKIDIQGPDAAILLDRVYINNWSNLPVGRARYGVMLREDGIVLDDGTTTRLGEHHFIMTTTTANAARVYQHLEFCLQVLWPELEVHITSVTDQWAQVAVAGPLARDTIVGLVDQGFDLSNQAFPYMAAAEVSVMGGVSARLFRISYSGELAYELAVPARAGNALMDALAEAGRPWDIVPYGTEALGVLRIEKGHVGGSEINGQTTAADLGLGRMMSTRKDCIGRVLASRPGLQSASRASLAGFRPVDRGRRLHAGAHFIGLGSAVSAENDEGHMTSVTFSPAVDGWIGLGLIRGGAMRAGERVRACDPVRDGDVEVEICAPVFVDPDGERLRG